MILFFYLFSVYDLNIKIVRKTGWTKNSEETRTNMIKETKNTFNHEKKLTALWLNIIALLISSMIFER